MEPIVSIRELSVVFDTDEGAIPAVERVSFDIERGEILGLVGESGCGKSVTAMSLLKLVPMPPGRIASGSVFFDGIDLLKQTPDRLCDIRGRRISFIFQEPMTSLSPLMRVGKQLAEALRLHNAANRRTAFVEAEKWLRRVGIPDAASRMKAFPYELSGGMRQRVMIALALMLDPELVIADEPTTALDVTIQAQVMDLLLAMRDRRTSILLITHDMGLIWEMCARVVVMYAAEVVEIAPVATLFSDPAHPYTTALIRSVPSFDRKAALLQTIPGAVPTPKSYAEGCRFADRCPLVFDRCRVEHPPLYTIDLQRKARCFLREPPAGTGVTP